MIRWLFCLSLLLLVLPVQAQSVAPEPTPAVSEDTVNEIAGRMYCPVCEFVPLDTCGEPACIVWRQEIRQQLEAGRTEDQIISDFVARYGDRVVGVPQDNTLRLLALVAPVVLGILALVVGVQTFLRWRRGDAPANYAPLPPNAPPDGDDYRARIESDLDRK